MISCLHAFPVWPLHICTDPSMSQILDSQILSSVCKLGLTLAPWWGPLKMKWERYW